MRTSRKAFHFYGMGSLYAALIASVLLTGCQGGLMGFRGPVPEVDRVPLVEGQWTSGVWTGRDLTVDYRYLRNGNNLDLYGRIDLAGHITHNFENIDRLHLQAYFLDGAGNIIGTRGAMSSGWSSRLVGGYSFPFHTTIALPPGTTALAFSYTGRAYSADRGEGFTPYDFFGGP